MLQEGAKEMPETLAAHNCLSVRESLQGKDKNYDKASQAIYIIQGFSSQQR